jgi:hypothetical protein
MPEQTAPVLILAPSGRDAAVAAAILGEVGLVSTVCPDLDVLVSGLDRAAGAVVTEKALLHSDRRAPPGFKRSSQQLCAPISAARQRPRPVFSSPRFCVAGH